MFSFFTCVNAECDYKTKLEVNTAAANVDADIEMVTKVLDLDENEHPEIKSIETEEEKEQYVYADFVYLNISNLSEKVYLKLTNEDDNLYRTIKYQDTVNGKYQYSVPDVAIIRTYTIKVYSNISECGNEELRTIEVKAPMFNDLSGTRICENNDALYCSEYITTPIDENISGIVEKYDNNSEENNEEIKEENVKNNYLYNILIGIVAILVIIIVITFIILRKKKKNKIIRGY